MTMPWIVKKHQIVRDHMMWFYPNFCIMQISWMVLHSVMIRWCSMELFWQPISPSPSMRITFQPWLNSSASTISHLRLQFFCSARSTGTKSRWGILNQITCPSQSLHFINIFPISKEFQQSSRNFNLKFDYFIFVEFEKKFKFFRFFSKKIFLFQIFSFFFKIFFLFSIFLDFFFGFFSKFFFFFSIFFQIFSIFLRAKMTC